MGFVNGITANALITSMSCTILAIDPGQNGGFAINYGVNKPPAIQTMPETECDVLATLTMIGRYAVSHNDFKVAIMEDQTGCIAGVRNSPTSSFAFGRGFGFLLGVLRCQGWQLHLVRAQKWQRALNLGSKAQAGGRTAWKNQLKVRAQQLYPGLKITLATADALLLLEYARVTGLGLRGPEIGGQKPEDRGQEAETA